MSVLWAGSMRGPRVQTGLVLLLLLLLSGRTHTVFGEEEVEAENPDYETEGTDAEEEEVTVPDGVTEPSVDASDTTPVSQSTISPDTEDGTNTEDLGSGVPFDLGVELPDSTTVFGTGTPAPEDEGLDILLIAVPAALAVLIVGAIVCGMFMYRRRSSKHRPSEMRREDPYLEGSSTEKVPMPMFEEDVPSVLELEMDELDDWMKKDGEPTDFNQQL